MSNGLENWYYSDKGSRIGPLSLERMQELVREGLITQNTGVWSGEGEWQPARHSALAGLFEKSVGVPPPLNAKDIDNRYIWLAVAIPIIGTIIEITAGQNLFWLYILANTVVCYLDERKLKTAGHKAPSNWMVLLVPIYLWQRANLLGQKKYYFWAWIATFALSFPLATMGQADSLAESACPIVTQIIHEQLGEDGASCKAVKIDKEVTNGFYKATATLDTGNELLITIEKLKDNQIMVRIPPQ